MTDSEFRPDPEIEATGGGPEGVSPGFSPSPTSKPEIPSLEPCCTETSPSEVPSSRIHALVRLLGDEDPKICSVAWTHLEKVGESALPWVRQSAHEASDSRVQVQCARFLTEWGRRDALRRWVDFARHGPPQLEEGVFLIAATEYPEVDMAAYKRRLDDFSSTLRGRIATVTSTEEAVRIISDFLFNELGFHGNSDDYFNPENSYINRVLETRLGIPISLSVLFLLLSRRLSIPSFGVGLPRHFVLKFRGRCGEVFLDAFHGGRLLSMRECLRFLSEAHIPFLDDCLRAVTDCEILTRMLGNLLKIYLNAGDQRRYDRISAMLQILA